MFFALTLPTHSPNFLRFFASAGSVATPLDGVIFALSLNLIKLKNRSLLKSLFPTQVKIENGASYVMNILV